MNDQEAKIALLYIADVVDVAAVVDFAAVVDVAAVVVVACTKQNLPLPTHRVKIKCCEKD